MSKFLQTASSYASSAKKDAQGEEEEEEEVNHHHARYIQSFVAKQERMEDEQDLVLIRSCRRRKRSSFSLSMFSTGHLSATQDALLQQFSNARKKQLLLASAKKSDEQNFIMLQIKQIYISFWPAACLLGMITVLLQFMVFCRGSGNGISGMDWTQESMTKHSAMLLAFCYSALAWTLSNGLVLNPQKSILLT